MADVDQVMKVVIAGASGFIGKALVKEFADAEVIALNRGGEPQPGAKVVVWNGATVGSWASELEGADAVINLSGAPITLKWTEENRRKIIDSREQSARAIGEAIRLSKRPPKAWVNSSAVGIYGDAGEEVVTERSGPGQGFLAEVCQKWETAAKEFRLPDTRVVLMRTGFVLGRDGGAFAPLKKLAGLGLGGAAGNGSQWVPWIHLEDLCRLFRFAIENSAMDGPVNGSAKEPIRNRDLMGAIRHALHRPWSPPVPKFMLSVVGSTMGPDPSVLLSSQRAIPEKALDAGFEWRFRSLDRAVADLLALNRS